MTGAEFQALALALREAGAVKVRCGDLEVIWSGPYAPSADARAGFAKTRSNGKREETPPANAEEARLRAYRRELHGEDDD